MHTVGTSVKGKREIQALETRAALIAAARTLFGTNGYAATSTEEIVAEAGVTKGALYHHFTDKERLFRVVFEQIQEEVASGAAAEFMRPNAWEALLLGCQLWIKAHSEATVRQICLVDARVVLGWESAREIETRFSAVTLRGALRRAMNEGAIRRQPLRPLSLMMIGALSEGCLYVAAAVDAEAASAEVNVLVETLLSGLRVEPTD